jgi:hypothetical protein
MSGDIAKATAARDSVIEDLPGCMGHGVAIAQSTLLLSGHFTQNPSPKVLPDSSDRRRWTAWLLQSIVGFLRLAKDRLRAFKGVGRRLIFAFDATVWGHIDIVDFGQRGFGSGLWLMQF